VGQSVVVDQVMNVSLSGLLLLSQHPISAGEALQLTLRGKDGERVELRAAVAWARPSKELPGIEAGVHMLPLAPQPLIELEQLMVKLLATRRGTRAALRFDVSLDAWWRGASGGPMTPLRVLDLSLSGAMLSGDQVPLYGERGLLALDLGEGLIAVPAAVAWRDVHRAPAASGLSFDRGSQANEFVAKVVRAMLFTPRRRGS
jgi:hypothetical protein